MADVMKFGGTSLATGERLEGALRFAHENPDARVVVFSAPGKRNGEPEERKVTEILIECARRRAVGQQARECIDEVVDRYRAIADHFGVAQACMGAIERDLAQRYERSGGAGPWARPILEAGGEINLTMLATHAARAMGTEARYAGPQETGFMLTADPSRGSVLKRTYASLKRFARSAGRIFAPGYVGITSEGRENTFDRGGSDITGAIWAAATGARRYLNCTDTNGVYSANPAKFSFGHRIPVITFLEARELGFSVIHPSALVPVDEARIPTHVLNTMDPHAPGTVIVPERDSHEAPIIGVNLVSGCRSFKVTRLGMNKLVGFGSRMYAMFAKLGISYSYDVTEADSVQVYPHDPLGQDAEDEVVRMLSRKLGAKVSALGGTDIVRLAGLGLAQVRDIDYAPLLALSEAGIARTMHIYSADGISYTIGVEPGRGYDAVRALHERFVGRPLPLR